MTLTFPLAGVTQPSAELFIPAIKCLCSLHGYCNVFLPSQQVIDDLTREKSEMEERLVDTEQRLNEFEEAGQKFLHLQVLAIVFTMNYLKALARYMYEESSFVLVTSGLVWWFSLILVFHIC